VYALTVAIVLAVLAVGMREKEIPARRNFALFRILLSGAMGVIGGLAPGFLHVRITGNWAWSSGPVGRSPLRSSPTSSRPTVVPNDPAPSN